MESRKVPSRVLVGKKNIFHAIALIRLLALNIEEGVSAIEFSEVEKSFSFELFHRAIDSLIILLAEYLNDEEDRSLAADLKKTHGIEFEEGSIIDTTDVSLRRAKADEELIHVSRKNFFAAFTKLMLYSHPPLEETHLSFQEMEKLFGRKAVQAVSDALLKLVGKKLHNEFYQFEEKEFAGEVNVWQ